MDNVNATPKKNKKKIVVEYESENEFNATITDVPLVSYCESVTEQTVRHETPVSMIVASAKVVKRRGRPPKDVQESVTSSTAKRGRGRPKKNTLTIPSPKKTRNLKRSLPKENSTKKRQRIE